MPQLNAAAFKQPLLGPEATTTVVHPQQKTVQFSHLSVSCGRGDMSPIAQPESTSSRCMARMHSQLPGQALGSLKAPARLLGNGASASAPSTAGRATSSAHRDVQGPSQCIVPRDSLRPNAHGGPGAGTGTQYSPRPPPHQQACCPRSQRSPTLALPCPDLHGSAWHSSSLCRVTRVQDGHDEAWGHLKQSTGDGAVRAVGLLGLAGRAGIAAGATPWSAVIPTAGQRP